MTVVAQFQVVECYTSVQFHVMEEGASATVASSDTNTDNKRIAKIIRATLQIWKSFHTCSAYSSFHGIPFLTAESRFNVKVMLWIVFLLAATIIMLYSLGAITSRFAARRTYLTSSYHFPKQMKLPAITFCNINPLKYSAVLSNNLSLEQADLFLAYLIEARSLPVSFFASFAQQYDAAHGGNNTLFQDMGHKIEDMIFSCTFDDRPCSVQDFTTRPSSIGLCHTFNPNGNLTSYHISRPGSRYGLLLRLNVEQYEYFTSTVGSTGINVFIHDHDHFPHISTHNSLLISPGVRTQMVITEKRHRLLPPPDGQCNDHVTLTYFKSYSRESCLIECETQLAIRECGCKAEYMPGSTRTCTLNETIYCLVPYQHQFQQKYCDCPVPCESVEYKIQESYARHPAPHIIDIHNNSNWLQQTLRFFPIPDLAIRNFTYPNGTIVYYLDPSFTSHLSNAVLKFAIYYDALEYIFFEEELQYTLFRYIADFIGYIGILIGAGLLTFFEVLELIYLFKPPVQRSIIN